MGKITIKEGFVHGGVFHADDVIATALLKTFPKEWRGASQEELKSQTGIKDLNFCHRTGFLCVAKTLEGACDAARLSMGNH